MSLLMIVGFIALAAMIKCFIATIEAYREGNYLDLCFYAAFMVMTTLVMVGAVSIHQMDVLYEQNQRIIQLLD